MSASQEPMYRPHEVTPFPDGSAPKAVAWLERRVAAAVGLRHAIAAQGVGLALEVALRSLGVGGGWRVLHSALAPASLVDAITRVGAEAVAIDVDCGTCQMCPRAVEDEARRWEASGGAPSRLIVLASHLHGTPCDMRRLMEIVSSRGLALVEDATDALGATTMGLPVGTLGLMALLRVGEGADSLAMVATDDSALAATSRGWREAIAAPEALAAPDEGWVAGLGVLLSREMATLAARRRVAATYVEQLSGLPGLQLPSSYCGSEPAWMGFVVRLAEGRDEVARAVEAESGLAVGRLLIARAGDGIPAMAAASRAVGEALVLPTGPGLPEDDVLRACIAIKGWLEARQPARPAGQAAQAPMLEGLGVARHGLDSWRSFPRSRARTRVGRYARPAS